MERARRTLRRAGEWREEHAELYETEFAARALAAAANGGKFAVQDALERVRDAHGVKVNNDFGAVFARWLAVEHPETARAVELRRSVFDLLMGGRDER